MPHPVAVSAAGLVCAILTGCADEILSTDRIRQNTAGVLGQPPGAVRITDRNYSGGTNTYYVAETPRGRYACVINGGTLLSGGMTNPPSCAPAGK